MIPVQYFFVLSALLFFIGVYGFCTRRNLDCCHSEREQCEEETFQLSWKEDAVEHSEVQIGCIQYKLDGDEHGNEVTACTEAIDSDEEQEC